MRQVWFTAILMVGFMIGLWACQDASRSTSGHTHGTGTHADAPTTPQALSYTVFSDSYELFVEFPPLVAGQLSRFAAHWTRLHDYSPVDSGRVILRLMAGSGKHEENGSPAPSVPGIFHLSLTPDQPGSYELQWIIQTPRLADTLVIPQVVVYPDHAAAIAAHPPVEEEDGITYLKEQAWETRFAIAPARRQTVHNVIRTSGEIQPVKSEEAVVTAKQDGLVSFRSRNLEPGREVHAGEQLFTLTTAGLLKGNLEEAFNVARANLERSKADFERARSLLEQQIIGQKEYQQRKMEYEVAQAEFTTISSGYTAGGQVVHTPIAGVVRNVLVRDGEFVREGTALVEISRNRRLLLHADVSQRFLTQLGDIHSAHFRLPYQEEVQVLEDYHGRLVSSGKMIEKASGFIPVLFELDNVGQLVPGAFVELFLLTTPIENALVIPKAALMEEYGTYYVFVQTAGERYERRELTIGVDDGKYIQVLAGIDEGEWIVIRGAYQVKLASMSGTIPEHGHEH